MHRPAFILALLSLVACNTPAETLTPEDSLLRPRSMPIEFVGLSVQRPIVGASDFTDVASPLFGAQARSGTHLEAFEFNRGLFLTSQADPRSEDQVILTLQMAPEGNREPRTVLRVPASLAYGTLFTQVVELALARTQEVTAADDDMSPWDLEYSVVSPNGGAMTLRVSYADGAAHLTLETENPRTSLRFGEVNTAAFSGDPFEKIGGTVWFELTRDEFDFFSSRAYGVSAGRDQNFDDFHLQPHDWLRITVTPMIDEGLVDVAFDVVMQDGQRIAFARSPASYVAGDQFRENVFLMLDNMYAAEEEQPGSSRPFTVPFHYDDPTGGGVVKVLAQGEAGVFRIAYVVESPVQTLREVEFVPYVGNPLANINDTPPMPAGCEAAGSTNADSGVFMMRFDASRTVRNSRNLDGPLRGTIRGSVFRAEDVTVSGPIDGAEELASFEIEDVDLTEGASAMEYALDIELPAGDYQVLGFLDIDHNHSETDGPDAGDPVTLPIGGYTLECARQPIVVEFALLLPEGV